MSCRPDPYQIPTVKSQVMLGLVMWQAMWLSSDPLPIHLAGCSECANNVGKVWWSPLDIFLWEFVKDQVYRTPVRDLADLRERICAAVNSVTPQILHYTWVEVEYLLDISRAIRPMKAMFRFVDHHHHQCCAQGQVLHCKLRHQGCNSSIANSGTYVAVLLGMNRCGSFPLLSVPHSFFSIWTNLKGSEKIPGAPWRRWGEWIWLTGPSGLHRNSPQGLNTSSIRVFDQIRDPEIPITLRPLMKHKVKKSHFSLFVVIGFIYTGC